MSVEFCWNEVGAVLAQGRQNARLTLQQVQDRTGLSRPTLIRAERGGDIQLSTLRTLLQCYGLPRLELGTGQ